MLVFKRWAGKATDHLVGQEKGFSGRGSNINNDIVKKNCMLVQQDVVWHLRNKFSNGKKMEATIKFT